MILVTILVLALTFTSVKLYQKLICGYCRCSAHMVGKVVIITGANSGIGFETAKDMAFRGARVIMACRHMGRANAAKDLIVKATGNTDIHCQQVELRSLQSIRDFCDRINETEKRLDVLINNAALRGHRNVRTEDDIHVGMQGNYFGPFLLTCLLLPLLKASAPSRIINLSSALHRMGEVDFENLNLEKKYGPHLCYANSKLYTNLMTLELSKKLKGTGVTVNAVHPGTAATNIFENISPIIRTVVKTTIKLFLQTVWEASQTSIYLAVAPEIKEVSGKYFCNCRETEPSKLSQDENLAARLWVESERIVKYSVPEQIFFT